MSSSSDSLLKWNSFLKNPPNFKTVSAGVRKTAFEIEIIKRVQSKQELTNDSKYYQQRRGSSSNKEEGSEYDESTSSYPESEIYNSIVEGVNGDEVAPSSDEKDHS